LNYFVFMSFVRRKSYGELNAQKILSKNTVSLLR
jgi:hypothetical protein